MTTVIRKEPSKETTVTLSGDHTLRVIRESSEDRLEIADAHGRVMLTIRMSEKGPCIELQGAQLTLKTTGQLRIDADRCHIHGRRGLALTSGGDVVLHTPGDLHSSARIQNIRATLGNVNVQANDDIRLNGERVLVNC